MFSLAKILGDPHKRYFRKIMPLIQRINELEPGLTNLSEQELKEKTRGLKNELVRGKSLDDILPEAFALVREAAKRTLQQRHFDVQLIAGIALHQGKVVEMKTGEGKTLAATLPAFLNALEGKGVHIVTVNDYLAKRDAVWMGQIYHLLGLSVGCLVHELSYLYDPEYSFGGKGEKGSSLALQKEEKERERDLLGGFKVVESFLCPVPRKEAYLADITYGTNNEFGFDYLRDNMVWEISEKVQRGFYFAIIDEVDSILIDEARTPLIISAPDNETSRWYEEFSRLVPKLRENIDYNIDEKMKVATLTEEGIEKIEKILGVDNIYEEKGIRYLHHLEQALRAEVFFQRDRDYIVKNGQVIIVDEFTGRLMPGRRWSGGLHQAIEAKEGVRVMPESKTLASITFQNYFRMYKKLAGMTGTAETSAEEFAKVYHLDTVVVPTNKPMIRVDLPDRVYKTEMAKFRAIVKETVQRHKKGQPLLIGTSSIEKNELLAKMLAREGIPCQILNAKNHQREGEIIAQAGRWGQVTVATNMAGRGVDIILGGNPPDLAEAEKVRQVGGLHVIGAQRHEARRIDNQLRGRAGRQGDPGSSQFFISLEDDLLRIFGGDKIKNLMETLKMPADEPIESKIISRAIEKAQSRVEGFNFDIRKHVLEYDDVIAKHRHKIYSWRDEILKKKREELEKYVLTILKNEIKLIVEEHQTGEGIDIEEVFEELRTIAPVSSEHRFKLSGMNDLEKIKDYLNKIIEDFFWQKKEKEGGENMTKILKYACLASLDAFWSEHLSVMDDLKSSVGLRAYGGRDPLVEYKTEGHRLFRELERVICRQISRTIFKLSLKS